jgi:hypothetical protein
MSVEQRILEEIAALSSIEQHGSRRRRLIA